MFACASIDFVVSEGPLLLFLFILDLSITKTHLFFLMYQCEKQKNESSIVFRL